MPFQIPVPEAVGNLLTVLLDRPVSAIAGPPAEQPLAAAVYHRDDGTIECLCLYDLSLASHIAAALLQLPPEGVADAMASRRLQGDYLDGFKEFLYISKQLVNHPGRPRITLGDLYPPGEWLPEPVQSLMREPAARNDVAISIPGYGKGAMSMLITAAALSPAREHARPAEKAEDDGWKAEAKVRLILDVLKGRVTLDEACRHHDISRSQYRHWAERFLQGGTHALDPSGTGDPDQVHRHIQQLDSQITTLTDTNNRLLQALQAAGISLPSP